MRELNETKYHEVEGWIKKSVPKITVFTALHHEYCYFAFLAKLSINSRT